MVLTRSHTARINNAVHLNRLDPNMLHMVLKKVPNVEMARLRRTCSRINNFVDEHKRLFSNRSMYPKSHCTCMSIAIRKENPPLFKLHDELVSFTNLDEKIAGFTLTQVLVVELKGTEWTPSKIEDTLEVFRKLNLSCGRLIFDGLPTLIAVSILATVNKVVTTEIQDLRTATFSSMDLRTLANCRHAATVGFSAYRADLHEVPMEILKNLRNIMVSHTKAAALQQLIENLRSTKDHGNWETLTIKFPYSNEAEWNDLQKIAIPFPRLYCYRQEATPFPYRVYVQELNSKQLVIAEYTGVGRDKYVFMFVEKGAASLTDCILKEFKFKKTSKNVVKKFTEAVFEKKGAILAKEVTRNINADLRRRRRAWRRRLGN